MKGRDRVGSGASSAASGVAGQGCSFCAQPSLHPTTSSHLLDLFFRLGPHVALPLSIASGGHCRRSRPRLCLLGPAQLAAHYAHMHPRHRAPQVLGFHGRLATCSQLSGRQ